MHGEQFCFNPAPIQTIWSSSVIVSSMAIALANQKIEVLHPDVLDSGVGLRVEAIASTNSLGTRLPMLSLAVPSSHMKTNG